MVVFCQRSRLTRNVFLFLRHAPGRRATRAVIFTSCLFFAGEAGLLGACSCFSDTLLAWGSAAAATLVVQTDRESSCTEWRRCRELARAAADRGEYETFHDLAWRAVQTGPPKNPELMYLLARAQALSGRAHDALVMLQRLAEMGVPSDAGTSDDFSHVRQLPGWPELAVRLERLNRTDSGGAVAAPATSTSPSPPAPPPPPPPPVPPTSVRDPAPPPPA